MGQECGKRIGARGLRQRDLKEDRKMAKSVAVVVAMAVPPARSHSMLHQLGAGTACAAQSGVLGSSRGRDAGRDLCRLGRRLGGHIVAGHWPVLPARHTGWLRLSKQHTMQRMQCTVTGAACPAPCQRRPAPAHSAMTPHFRSASFSKAQTDMSMWSTSPAGTAGAPRYSGLT